MDGVVGAFAEDIDMVIRHIEVLLPKLQFLFDQFANATGLNLYVEWLTPGHSF